MPEMEERPLVRWFAQQMERKLRLNDHKHGWQSMSNPSIRERIAQELDEVDAVLAFSPPSPIRLVDECADVANFLAFMAWNNKEAPRA